MYPRRRPRGCICVKYSYCVKASVCLSVCPSHTVNLLGNLPLKCLDVLLALELHEGSLEFMGVNMDVINALLTFLEKRLHQVGGPAMWTPRGLGTSCGYCFRTIGTGR